MAGMSWRRLGVIYRGRFVVCMLHLLFVLLSPWSWCALLVSKEEDLILIAVLHEYLFTMRRLMEWVVGWGGGISVGSLIACSCYHYHIFFSCLQPLCPFSPWSYRVQALIRLNIVVCSIVLCWYLSRWWGWVGGGWLLPIAVALLVMSTTSCLSFRLLVCEALDWLLRWMA